MPRRYMLPTEMEDAALLDALWPRTMAEIDDMPEKLIQRLLLYRAVRNVATYGGDLKL